jgi:flagellar motility protein MotE (MotC chaperone)
MGHASLNLISTAAGGLLLLGALLSAPSLAADEGWVPVVTKASKAERVLSALPPMPEIKPPKAKKLAPAATSAAAVPARAEAVLSQPEPSSVAGPAEGVDIVTGSIDAVQSTGNLSPSDSERLFAEDAPPDALITGTVDTPRSDLARSYCVNIAGAAADARLALQRAKLVEAEREIGKRIAVLEAKAAEYKTWVERRDEFLKRATNSLVKIYTQMEPDAAALQLVAMDEETAAALLVKLEPQKASAILNEMVPEKAARLTATIAGAARAPRPGGIPASAAGPAGPRGEAPERPDPGEGRS